MLLQDSDYDRRHTLCAEFENCAERINSETTKPWERVDLAMGMVEYKYDSDTNAEQVMKNADMKMYNNKRSGRQKNAIF